MNRVFLPLVLALVSAVAAYFVGEDFIKSAHYPMFWAGLVVVLIASALVLWKLRPETNVIADILLGIGFGWLVSIGTILAVLFVGEVGFLEELGSAEDQFGFGELITYILTIGFLHFGWIPFLVLFVATGWTRRREADSEFAEQ